MENTAPIPPNIVLRDVRMSDLPIFFDQQLDPEANHMAAFTSKDPTDRAAFMEHWARILRDETNHIQTILYYEMFYLVVYGLVDIKHLAFISSY